MILIQKIFAKLHCKNSTKKGFTLVELLVAASLSFIIITISGVILIQMTKAGLKSEASHEQQWELNRLFTLISQEIENSEISFQPGTDPYRYNIPINIINQIPANAQYILLLKNKNLRAPIVYFTLPINSPYNQQTWLKKETSNMVLYRWGPRLGLIKNYQDGGNPDNWGSPIAIADSLSSATITTKCSDATSWTLIPDSATKEGLYVCVKNGGKLVSLHLTSIVKVDQQTIKSEINTQVYAKASK